MQRLVLTLFTLTFFALIAQCQWLIIPEGVLVDSITGKPYRIENQDGSQAELYKKILKNVHTMFASPNDVVSTIENELISVRGVTETHIKYMGINGLLEPTISVKVEFKDGRIRVSAQWTEVKWMGGNPIDPHTLLSVGNLRCFNKKGEINNEKRYLIYNNLSQKFIDRIVNDTALSDDW